MWIGSAHVVVLERHDPYEMWVNVEWEKLCTQPNPSRLLAPTGRRSLEHIRKAMMYIVVAEYDEDSARLISLVLREAGYQVVTVFDGASALQLIQESRPHLVLLEVAMPTVSGFDICRRIRRTSDVPIIFLTTSAHIQEEVTGLKIGGDDYIVKPFEPLEMRARVTAVLRRSYRNLPPPPLLGTQRLVLEPLTGQVRFENGRVVSLPPVEFRLLHYLVEQAGQVVSTHDIVKKVWGDGADDNPNLVAHYIRRLRHKLGSQPGEYQHIVTIRPRGYKFEPHPWMSPALAQF